MNSNTTTMRTSLFARRVLPILGIVTLTVALGACQTQPQGVVAPEKQVVEQGDPNQTAPKSAHQIIQEYIDKSQEHAPETAPKSAHQIIQEYIDKSLEHPQSAPSGE